jgi:glycosyltransferase involved in cell wall biosynthesis
MFPKAMAGGYREARTVQFNSDHIITVSDTVKAILMKDYKLPSEKVTVIKNGVDTDLFHPQGLQEEKYILFPNALRYPSRKGLILMLPVLKSFLKSHPDYKIWFTGPSSPKGDRIFSRLNKNTFFYKGIAKEEEMPGLYEQATCVICPSIYEGYSLVPLEVMASGGVPVVSTSAAVDVLINGSNGLILPPAQIDWEGGLELIITESGMREMIRHYNETARMKTWTDAAREHTHLIRKIYQDSK